MDHHLFFFFVSKITKAYSDRYIAARSCKVSLRIPYGGCAGRWKDFNHPNFFWHFWGPEKKELYVSCLVLSFSRNFQYYFHSFYKTLTEFWLSIKDNNGPAVGALKSSQFFFWLTIKEKHMHLIKEAIWRRVKGGIFNCVSGEIDEKVPSHHSFVRPAKPQPLIPK